jgi:DNA polymerase-1
MLVSTENFHRILNNLDRVCSLDTETTGLYSFKDDCLFSIIISDSSGDYFKDYPEENITSLPRSLIPEFASVFGDEHRIWFLQNAKFDMHMLARECLVINGRILDLMVMERLQYNQHLRYRLTDITKRWGEFKDDRVMAYIDDHKLKTKVTYPEFNKEVELLHFDRVPFSVIQPYGEQDGIGTLNTGKKILAAIKDEDNLLLPGNPTQAAVLDNESKLTHTLFRMEQRGVKLDTAYCSEALKYYTDICNERVREFKEITGVDFVKGTTVFEEVFKSEEAKWEKTEKGAWKWDAEMLESLDHPAAKVVTAYAEAKKQSEYFANFLYYADWEGVLHSDFQQSGTVTSRLSCRDPNLQNLTNPDKYEGETDASVYPVRRAFIPREGFFFVMPDYSQVEFRMMLDYARANSLINEVLAGHDVHTATANVSGTSRKEAKQTNFLTAYGGGVVKLAGKLYKTKGSKAQLGAIYKQMFGWRMSEEEKAALPTVTQEMRDYNTPLIKGAYDIQQSIFRAAPEIKDFIKNVQKTAENRGYVRNWLGRRYFFSDKRWAYKAPNHLIQGGSAEVIKIAMNRVDEYLQDKQSKMLMSIHDELIIEVKYGEEFVVDAIKAIMENVYPYKRLPLLVDVEYSYKNLADKSSWPPEHLEDVKEARNLIQSETTSEVR